MQSIMSKAGIEQNVKQRDIQEKFDLLIDANDLFLDRAVSFFLLQCFFCLLLHLFTYIN